MWVFVYLYVSMYVFTVATMCAGPQGAGTGESRRGIDVESSGGERYHRD